MNWAKCGGLLLFTFAISFGGPLRAAPPDTCGVAYVVGGVGGLENLKLAVQVALRMEGLKHEVVLFEWTHGKGKILKDLQDSRHYAGKIEELADELKRAHWADPDRPIYVIARSGGAGLALAAAERLPEGTLERIILLSPAVSPQYNLRPALRACRHEIVSFHSDLDVVVLGWGTSQFGTSDRHYCNSAGRVGFRKPDASDPEGEQLYRRLVQVRWTPAMLLTGHTGGHVGSALPTFLAREVTPWLKP
ncbi:MAG: hypothetical protein JNM56_17455 [Planctomycetia bacterium]|nr:hypothetical protein [Planctomycetia bacterium]